MSDINEYNLEFIKNLSKPNMEALMKTPKMVEDANGKQHLMSFVGESNDQVTKPEINDFYSPVSRAILKEIDSNDYFEVQVKKGYLLLKTHDTIFKFTKNKKVTVNALKCLNLRYFYFSKSKSKKCNKALRSVLKDLNKQTKKGANKLW
ncbi:hypothetical protein ACYATM_06640 [Lactobacillaceae bacterium Scapto_B20]